MPLKRIGRVNVGNKKVVIYFEDGEELEVNYEVYLDFPVYAGKEIDEKTIKEIKKRNDSQKLYDYAAKYVLSRLTSEYNLITKLESKGASKKEITTILKKLTSAGIFDEKEHFEGQFHQLNNSDYGELRIKDELFKKGYKEEMIKTLYFDDNQEREKIEKHLPKLVKKYSNYSHRQIKEHVYANLLRLGFKNDLAYEAISNINFNYDRENTALIKSFEYAVTKYNTKYFGKPLELKVLNYLLDQGFKPSDIKELLKEHQNVFVR